MSTDEDWKKHKIGQLSRFQGMTFRLADYSAASTDWDHDHCEGFTATFAEFDRPEIQHSGYFTTHDKDDDASEIPEFIKQMRDQGREVLAKPDTKNWVCTECFDEFRAILDWKLDSSA